MGKIKMTNYWNESVNYISRSIAQSYIKTSKKNNLKKTTTRVPCGCGDPGCSSCQPCRVSVCGCD